jgi:hypothetical protein
MTGFRTELAFLLSFVACNQGAGPMAQNAPADAASDASDAVEASGATRDGADAAGEMDGPSEDDLVEGPCTLPPPRVNTLCPTLCNNGVIDSCSMGPGAGGAGGASSVTEACDTDVPTSVTCESLGYQGGTLRCGIWCGLVVDGCRTCTNDSHVAGCVDSFLEGDTQLSGAIATDASGVAVLSYEFASSQARFALLGPDLSLASPPLCYRTPSQLLGLARVATGWLAVMQRNDGPHGGIGTTVSIPLDREGHRRGTTTVISRSPLGDGALQSGLLVDRPDGGPLVALFSQNAVEGHLLNDDGTVVGRAHLFDGVVYASATYTGDGFLATATVQNSSGTDVVTAKIGLTGNVESSQFVTNAGDGGAYVYPPQIAWTGTEALLMWSVIDMQGSGNSRSMAARLDAKGTLLASPVVVSAGPNSLASNILADSLGTFALLGESQGISAIELDASGNRVGPSYPLTRDPSSTYCGLRSFGTGAIAACFANFREPIPATQYPRYPSQRLSIIKLTLHGSKDGG